MKVLLCTAIVWLGVVSACNNNYESTYSGIGQPTTNDGGSSTDDVVIQGDINLARCIASAGIDTSIHSSCREESNVFIDTILVDFKTDLLALLNSYRQSPRLDPSPTTSLPTLQWSNELATVAEAYSTQCTYIHDCQGCRDLPGNILNIFK